MVQSNVVYVGSKPVMTYCLAVMSVLSRGGGEVTLMARGRSISKAVDVTEIVRNRYLMDLVVRDVSIGTENLEFHDGTPRNVSKIAITLGKD